MAHAESQDSEVAVESRLVTDADELSEGDVIHIEDEHWIARARVLSVGDAITDPTNRNFELEVIASENFNAEGIIDWTAKPGSKLTWRIHGFAADHDTFEGWRVMSDAAVIMRVEE
jgi:hypothetical protein